MKKRRDHRAPEPWKVRWCVPCTQYEFDTGSPRGWVKLMGEPPSSYGRTVAEKATGD